MWPSSPAADSGRSTPQAARRRRLWTAWPPSPARGPKAMSSSSRSGWAASLFFTACPVAEAQRLPSRQQMMRPAMMRRAPIRRSFLTDGISSTCHAATCRSDPSTGRTERLCSNRRVRDDGHRSGERRPDSTAVRAAAASRVRNLRLSNAFYDVAPDGRFLVNTAIAQTPLTPITDADHADRELDSDGQTVRLKIED